MEEMFGYDVFLSFRGPDTRRGFTDVLYNMMVSAGLRVFKDDDEIPVGKPIKVIFQAMKISEICVPIFSRTFASSPWCLDEVAKMKELHRDNVVPIFYDVEPDDVKLKTQTYRVDLEKHCGKYGEDRVKKWKDALQTVARIKGKEVLDRSHVEFCKQFVNEICRKLKPRNKYETDHLIGMEDQIESVKKMLDIGSPDVRYIGIYGMGGIGKTTLAKAIFNEVSANFDHSCFLEDVRESSLRFNGLKNLQKQLQESLDPFASGLNFPRDIRERFRNKKVLIVLDDVDKSEQIQKLAGKSNWFGSGSRIVVTTRNVNVLHQCGELHKNEVWNFEMSTLNHSQALRLFNRYAFRDHTPTAMFESFAREIVSTAGGLPLALEIIGSFLYNKNENIWRETASKLRTQDNDTMERLKISYDALGPQQKQIFLDIACFFIGSDIVTVLPMWEGRHFYPHLGLEQLNSMSLIKTTKDGRIWMHDQLRSLGRDIVRNESIRDPKNRSRVWENEDAWNVLTSKEGQCNIEALCVDKPSGITLSPEHLAKFQRLWYLKLVGTNIEGDFTNLLPELARFSWHYCPPSFNATNLKLKKLVVLDLSFSSITESWGGWSFVQNSTKLKSLDLSNCEELTRTPEFSERNHLKKLILRGCSKMREIHSSIGKLKSLEHLDLRFCNSLLGLPEEICSLENLEELLVTGACRQGWTFNLPETIDKLKSLLVLELKGLNIVHIPDGIGGLIKLKYLSLERCLDVKELPASLGDLESLIELHLKECPIEELPDSIGRLQNLKVLNVSYCKLRKLPASIGMLKRLEVIDAFGNHLLQQVPEELGMLSNLRKLDLSHSCISELPSTISQLPHLEELGLVETRHLQKLPYLPWTVMKLKLPRM